MILPFVTEYRPSVPNLNNILMAKWHLIKNQPVLREIFKQSNPFIQKREDVKRYTRQSQTLKVNYNYDGPMGVVFGLSIF